MSTHHTLGPLTGPHPTSAEDALDDALAAGDWEGAYKAQRRLTAASAKDERRKVLEEVKAQWCEPAATTPAALEAHASRFTCWLQGQLTQQLRTGGDDAQA